MRRVAHRAEREDHSTILHAGRRLSTIPLVEDVLPIKYPLSAGARELVGTVDTSWYELYRFELNLPMTQTLSRGSINASVRATSREMQWTIERGGWKEGHHAIFYKRIISNFGDQTPH